jgi:hypothetical protein
MVPIFLAARQTPNLSTHPVFLMLRNFNAPLYKYV